MKAVAIGFVLGWLARSLTAYFVSEYENRLAREEAKRLLFDEEGTR